MGCCPACIASCSETGAEIDRRWLHKDAIPINNGNRAVAARMTRCNKNITVHRAIALRYHDADGWECSETPPKMIVASLPPSSRHHERQHRQAAPQGRPQDATA